MSPRTMPSQTMRTSWRFRPLTDLRPSTGSFGARSAIADEQAPPVAAPRPPPSLSEGSQVTYEDFDDIRGNASAWRRLWLADKFRFRIPLRFHEILETIKRALVFPADPQASSTPAPSQSQAHSLFKGVLLVPPHPPGYDAVGRYVSHHGKEGY